MTLRGSLALAVEACIAFFAGSLALLHRLRPDLDPSTRYISEYAVGHHGTLMGSAFVALGVGSGALTLGLNRPRAGAPSTPTGLALLGCFSAGITAVGLFRTDLSVPGTVQTRTGRIHDIAGLLAFRSIALAMIVLSLRFRRTACWRGLFPRGLALALLASGVLVWLRQTRRPGVPQRIFVAIVVIWLSMVAERLRAITAGH